MHTFTLPSLGAKAAQRALFAVDACMHLSRSVHNTLQHDLLAMMKQEK